MKTPTQEQFQTVIDNLIKANTIAKNNAPVNMMNGIVEKNVCGTPMCHGGWYVVAVFGTNKKDKDGYPVDFTYGANQIAIHLGFDYEDDLIEWAVDCADIWGNKYGGAMFSGGEAFGYTDESGFDLTDIIQHWKGVKERASKQEAQPV